MRRIDLIAVGSVGIVSSAFAGVQPPPNPNDTVINLANFSFATQLTGNWSAVLTQTEVVPASLFDTIGFTIEFDYDENPLDASYAADLAMKMSAASMPFPGNDFALGQNSYGAASFGYGDDWWDFGGSISTMPGHYKHTTLFAPGMFIDMPGEIWTFQFQMTYNGGNSFSNFMITLHNAPAPATFALLGLAGVVGPPRRRRR